LIDSRFLLVTSAMDKTRTIWLFQPESSKIGYKSPFISGRPIDNRQVGAEYMAIGKDECIT